LANRIHSEGRTLHDHKGAILKTFICLMLVGAFGLSACGVVPTPDPTATPAPTATRKPTATSISPPTLDFNAESFGMLVVLDGFSLTVPFPLRYQNDENLVLISDEDGTLTISFTGDLFDGVQPLTEYIDLYLDALERRGAELVKSKPVDVEVDGVTGVALDLTGNFGDAEVEGSIIAVAPHSDIVLIGIGLSSEENAWENDGRAVFEGILGTIRFTAVDAECPVSTDADYGYSEERAVQVGGDFFNGPSRERAYLDHLRGPNGEQVSYERQGSTMAGDVILDIYYVTGPGGIEAVLYLDVYNFSEPQAPIGFTCDGAFPLSAP
jgi:hypothetical protein